MAEEKPLYDLVLLLDPKVEDERREAILTHAEDIIEKSGEIVSRHDWGVRTMAYEVHKSTDADYHLLQFHGDTAVLEALNHSLKITDGVLRFRIVKLRPGTPAPPDLRPSATVAAAEPVEAEEEGVAIYDHVEHEPVPAEAEAE